MARFPLVARAWVLVVVAAFLAGIALPTAGSAAAQEELQYEKCYCVNDGHAWVQFRDLGTGGKYSRGLYGKGYGTGQDAPPVPTGGQRPPPSPSPLKGGGGGDSCCGSGGIIDALFGSTGTIQDDGKNVALLCYCVKVNKESYDKAVTAANNASKDYKLHKRNCVDFVYEIAAAEGTKLPDKGTTSGVSDPKKTRQNFQKAKDGGDTNVKEGSEATPHQSHFSGRSGFDHAAEHPEFFIQVPGVLKEILARDAAAP